MQDFPECFVERLRNVASPEPGETVVVASFAVCQSVQALWNIRQEWCLNQEPEQIVIRRGSLRYALEFSPTGCGAYPLTVDESHGTTTR